MSTAPAPGAGGSSPAGWTVRDMPDQAGRTAVVTGANSGLGLVTARELARAGARVVMAVRDVAKGEAAARDLPGRVEVRPLDLADLDSVRRFADGVTEPFDVLVDNAGVMAAPLSRTAQGFETQFGVNVLGHFALTGLLLDRLTDRVVWLSSEMHRIGRIDLDDLNWDHRRYRRWGAYGQSKLADLVLAFETQRRAAAAGSSLRSFAAHPGYAATNLQSHTESVADRLLAVGNRLFAQSAEGGAVPTLFAATAPDLPGGGYYGPDGALRNGGHPTLAASSRRSHDEATAAALWAACERLTGVTWDWSVSSAGR